MKDAWLDTDVGREARATWGPLLVDITGYHRDLDEDHGVASGTHSRHWWQAVAAIYRRLPYKPKDSPPFDPKSKRRYDR